MFVFLGNDYSLIVRPLSGVAVHLDLLRCDDIFIEVTDFSLLPRYFEAVGCLLFSQYLSCPSASWAVNPLLQQPTTLYPEEELRLRSLRAPPRLPRGIARRFLADLVTVPFCVASGQCPSCGLSQNRSYFIGHDSRSFYMTVTAQLLDYYLPVSFGRKLGGFMSLLKFFVNSL